MVLNISISSNDPGSSSISIRSRAVYLPLIPSRDNRYYDPALGLRIKDYILGWMRQEHDGYDYLAESQDLDVVPDEYHWNDTVVGITPRDRARRLMNSNPAVVEKITDKHNL